MKTNSLNVPAVLQLVCSFPGWHSLIQSVTDMDDYCTNQSDYDTPTQEESEPQSTSGRG